MKSKYYVLPVLVGLIAGQVFAEGSRPFKVSNTLRFGHDDNVEKKADGKSSSYVEDVVVLSYLASLSDRTDFKVNSKLTVRNDTENDFHPNIKALLTHSVSDRFMIRLSEFYKQDDKTNQNSDGRKNYRLNKFGVNTTHVLSEKNRLDFLFSHEIARHDTLIEGDDYTKLEGGIKLSTELVPSKTSVTFGFTERETRYDKRDTSLRQSEPVVTLNHAFNQDLKGRVKAGCTYSRPSGAIDSSVDPLFGTGLTYSFSPKTKLSADYVYKTSQSGMQGFYSQTAHDIRVGFKQEVTAKIKAEAEVSFVDTSFDDSEVGGASTGDENLKCDVRLSYQMNRINFFEVGVSHTRVEFDSGVGDWDQNRFDLGWRINL